MLTKKYLILFYLLIASLFFPGFIFASDKTICDLLDPSSSLYRAYCISPFSALNAPDGPAHRTTNIVLEDIAMPRAATVTEEEGQKVAIARPRLLGGYLRYESARADHADDADIYGGTLGIAWDIEQFSLGIIIPYDYMDYNVVKAHRVGAIGFGTYTLGLAQNLDLMFGANVSYMHVSPFDESFGREADTVNYYGGGLSTTLTYDAGAVVPALAVLYQYTKDDSDSEHDYSHLLKVAGQLGVRLGERVIVSPYVIWNRDVSAYATSDDIYSFFDVGAELGISITETFTLNVGYKKVLGISDVENDMGYLGVLYRF